MSDSSPAPEAPDSGGTSAQGTDAPGRTASSSSDASKLADAPKASEAPKFGDASKADAPNFTEPPRSSDAPNSGEPPGSPPKEDGPSIGTKAANAVRGAGRGTSRQLMRPRVRLAIVGIAFLLAALLLVEGSIGTVLTVLGILALLIAWLGSRTEGRLLVEWGADGARISFDNQVAPAQDPIEAQRALEAPSPAPAQSALAAVPTPQRDVIDGEAHTVEIDAGELRALIDAAERAQRTSA